MISWSSICPHYERLLRTYNTCSDANYCIPDAKRGYYGFIIVVRALVRVRRDFLLATYSPHFFPDFFHIWQVAGHGRGLATLSFW